VEQKEDDNGGLRCGPGKKHDARGRHDDGSLFYTLDAAASGGHVRDREAIKAQIAYYRARAGEYDEWFLRLGRYDRGAEHRSAWFGEIGVVERALREEIRGHDILELACGTGLWTRHLVSADRRVVALDASPEVIAINRARVTSGPTSYILGDIFAPPLAGRFDTVFFSFWLSHVPPERFDEFWASVRRLMRAGGHVFFVDSLLEQESTAVDHDRLDTSGVVRRKLNDGRQFDIIKVFHDPAALEVRLRNLGWTGWVRSTGRFFLYGSVA
jgi:demethylmenaquinone methyltransferase/2-methoxy-6-polyprenyl-1,4-benzoquinol methylase